MGGDPPIEVLLLRPVTAPPLVLASASPRRSELLQRVGLSFDICPADIDETPKPDESPAALVERLSREKARTVAEALRGSYLVVAADTIVVRDGTILNKPPTPDAAKGMLRSLGGRSHEVITGWAMTRDDGRSLAGNVVTRVHFRELNDHVVERYVATGEPMDKAGAYGIQGVGAMLVTRIEGSYTNVVGLPLVEILQALPQLGGPAL